MRSSSAPSSHPIDIDKNTDSEHELPASSLCTTNCIVSLISKRERGEGGGGLWGEKRDGLQYAQTRGANARSTCSKWDNVTNYNFIPVTLRMGQRQQNWYEHVTLDKGL